MSDILEEIRLQAERSPEEQFSNEFNKIKKDFVIDRNVEYPDPEYLIEIGGVPTMPKGNLVALSAKWKNGKTFFCDIISSIFLGCDQFASCRSRQDEGWVLFFDTEQAVSDTARIRKTIDAMTPEQRHNDLEVYCLRNAAIDTEADEQATISRFDFISRAIEHDRPDLVIIDGIADLIYNYNDVIESQEVVNKLAAIANEFDCCIVVVMHQNKGKQDKSMKGHIGTMLYQKCSDVFNVEKCGSVFVASHAVSRHRSCGDIIFTLDADAVPEDGTAARQQQLQLKREDKRRELAEQVALCLEDTTVALKRSDIVNLIKEHTGAGTTKAYELFGEAAAMGVLETYDKKHYFLKQS